MNIFWLIVLWVVFFVLSSIFSLAIKTFWAATKKEYFPRTIPFVTGVLLTFISLVVVFIDFAAEIYLLKQSVFLILDISISSGQTVAIYCIILLFQIQSRMHAEVK